MAPNQDDTCCWLSKDGLTALTALPALDARRRSPAILVRGFMAWGIAGLLLAGALLSAASVGLYVLPVALIVLVLAARSFGFGPQSFGAITGAGLPLIAVGVLSALEPGTKCSGPISLPPGQTAEITCGQVISSPWFVAGAIAVTLGIGAAMLRTRHSSGRGTVDG